MPPSSYGRKGGAVRSVNPSDMHQTTEGLDPHNLTDMTVDDVLAEMEATSKSKKGKKLQQNDWLV